MDILAELPSANTLKNEAKSEVKNLTRASLITELFKSQDRIGFRHVDAVMNGKSLPLQCRAEDVARSISNAHDYVDLYNKVIEKQGGFFTQASYYKFGVFLMDQLGAMRFLSSDNKLKKIIQNRIEKVEKIVDHILSRLSHPSIDLAKTALQDGKLRGKNLSKFLERFPRQLKFDVPTYFSNKDIVFNLLSDYQNSHKIKWDTMDGGDCFGFQPSSINLLLAALETVNLDKTDCLADLGGGDGRAALLMHYLSGASAVAVERQKFLVNRGQNYIKRNKVPGVQVIHSDVRDFDFSDTNVFLLINPFEGEVLRDTTKRINERAKEAYSKREKISLICIRADTSGIDMNLFTKQRKHPEFNWIKTLSSAA